MKKISLNYFFKRHSIVYKMQTQFFKYFKNTIFQLYLFSSDPPVEEVFPTILPIYFADKCVVYYLLK